MSTPELELDPATWRGLEYLEAVSGPGAIVEMVEDFLRDAPPRLVSMEAALAAGDWPSLSRLAHDLKSNSATIGALQLSSRAAEIERIAREGSATTLAPLLVEIGAMLPRALLLLQERARTYPAP